MSNEHVIARETGTALAIGVGLEGAGLGLAYSNGKLEEMIAQWPLWLVFLALFVAIGAVRGIAKK